MYHFFLKLKFYLDKISFLEIFEAHFDKLLEKVNWMDHYIAYLVLGYLILKTGSNLPDDLREKIIDAGDWENDRKEWKMEDTDEDREFLDDRKEILLDFQEKIRNHKPYSKFQERVRNCKS